METKRVRQEPRSFKALFDELFEEGEGRPKSAIELEAAEAMMDRRSPHLAEEGEWNED